MTLFLVSVLAVLMIWQIAPAATITWSNTGTTGDWALGSNWTGGSVPGTADNASVQNGGTCNVTTDLGATAAITSIYLGSTADATGTMTISGNGRLVNSAYLVLGTNNSSGTDLGTGTLNITGSARYTSGSSGVSIGNYGGAGYLNISGSASATFNADVAVAASKATNIAATGAVTLQDTATMWATRLAIGIAGRGTMDMDGTASLTTRSRLTVGSQTTAGTFTVTGGGGSIHVGNNTGAGYEDLLMWRTDSSSLATLAFNVDDTGITKFTVQRNLDLRSSGQNILLDVTALAGCANGTYTLMTWGGIMDTTYANGATLALTQASIDAGWSLNIDTTGKSVTATLVPEPMTAAVMILGGALALVRRRRK